MIKLFVGLGNPGPEYEDTRHNAGFWWIDALARELKVTLVPERSYWGLMARTTIHGQHVWLLEPQTFMNLSGKSVGTLARFFKIQPEEILVVHDELDFEPGVVKLKLGGSHGGHNGLRDIDAHVGKEYRRVRIGIGHPGHKDLVLHWVLRDFEPDERDTKTGWLPKVLNALAEESALLVEGGAKADEKYMSRVANLAPPPNLPARLNIKE